MVDIYKLVEPQDGDIIIAEVDVSEDGVDVESAMKIHNHLKKQFPFNKVITTPSFCSLDLYTKEEAIEYFENLLKEVREERF